MANGAVQGGGPAGQEFCLKWNNHRTTIISVMDTLLEEESLVDVTLSADGQFIRAHRVILSACSPYFRQLFKSSFLNDKHPVIIMKDVDFDNLKSLVEYMYKGEANVPQQMLPTFIQTAESLQIRGLAEGASKQKLEQVAELNTMSPHLSVPNIPVTPQTNLPPYPPKSETKKASPGTPDSILAARLKTMVDNPPLHMLDFQEQLALAARQAGHTLGVPPPMKENKKRRKMEQMHPNTSSPVKPDSNGHKEISVKKDLMSRNARLSPKTSHNIMGPSVSSMVSNLSLQTTNNNDESDSDVLKIDEDGDKKDNSDKDDDIAEVDNGYGGMDDSEEEITMDNNERRTNSGVAFINPWTGEEMPGLSHVQHHDVDHDEDSLQGGEGPFFPSLMDQSALASGLTEEKPALDPRDPAIQKYSCQRCGRSYLHQATLVRHQRYECGISASYPCQLCGRKFKRRDVLKGHMEKCMNKSSIASPLNVSNAASPLALTMSIPSMPTISAISSLACMPSLPGQALTWSGQGGP